MDELTEYDKITILSALKKRIDVLWSIYPHSDRQHSTYIRYKCLFEKMGGDYNRDYESELTYQNIGNGEESMVIGL